MWDTSRVGRLVNPWNQSVLGLLAHVSDPAPPDRLLWALLAAGVAVLGLVRAVRVYRRGDDLAAVTLAGLTACLVSPISWVHHLYWVVPAVVLLADVAAGTPVLGTVSRWSRDRPRALAAGAGLLAVAVAVPFLLSPYWTFVPEAGMPTSLPADIVGRSVYTCAMLAMVVLLPARDLTGRTARGPIEGTAARRHCPESEVQGHLDLADGLLDDQRAVARVEPVHLVLLPQLFEAGQVVVDLPDRAAQVVGPGDHQHRRRDGVHVGDRRRAHVDVAHLLR